MQFLDSAPQPSGWARALAALISGLAAIALAWTVYDYSYGFDALSLGVWKTALHYSHWATALVAIVFAGIALGSSRAAAPIVIGQVIIALAILLIHYWFFRGLDDFLASPLRSKVAHGALPLLIAFYWIAFVDKRSLRGLDPLAWMTFPLLYGFYALGCGAISGEYAYAEGDASKLGYARVLGTIGLTGLFGILLGYLLLLVDRQLPTTWKAGALREPAGVPDQGP